MFSFNVLTGAIQIYYAENSIIPDSWKSKRDNVQLLFNILEFWQLV